MEQAMCLLTYWTLQVVLASQILIESNFVSEILSVSESELSQQTSATVTDTITVQPHKTDHFCHFFPTRATFLR